MTANSKASLVPSLPVSKRDGIFAKGKASPYLTRVNEKGHHKPGDNYNDELPIAISDQELPRNMQHHIKMPSITSVTSKEGIAKTTYRDGESQDHTS